MLDDGSISGVTSLPTDNSNLPSGTAVNWDSQLPSIVTLHPDEKITHQTDMDFNPPLSLIATSVNPEASEDLTDHQLKLWRMRWCFFWAGIIFCSLWMIACIVTSVVIFCVTKSFFSFLISSGTAVSIEFMRRFANYLLPLDEKNFQLKKLKIQMRTENARSNTRPANNNKDKKQH